jgi:hypothetical protein
VLSLLQPPRCTGIVSIVLLDSAGSKRIDLPVCLWVFDEAIAVRGLDWAKMMAMLKAEHTVNQPQPRWSQPPRRSAGSLQYMP